MERLNVMLIAGEPSGDLLAAELVAALRAAPQVRALPFAPRFFGAGGPHLRAAGAELALDLTAHSVVGLLEALRHYRKFRRVFDELLRLACAREPDAIILVDFSGFNRRFARAVRRRVNARHGAFHNRRPRLIQYVSPQVWASRPGRADALARDLDLLLCLFEFESAWYARRTPRLPVEFVGHPLCDRLAGFTPRPTGAAAPDGGRPLVLLLPGSRRGELEAHLPVMLRAAAGLDGALRTRPCQGEGGARWRVVLPNEALAERARQLIAETLGQRPPNGSSALRSLETCVGGLGESLAEARLALASTGTVTLECALLGVPTVALYRTSWTTYQIAKRIVTVKYLAMPNLLAGEMVYPEFIQDAATEANLQNAGLDLLLDEERRRGIQAKLARVVAALGGPGASARATQAVLRTLGLGGGAL